MPAVIRPGFVSSNFLRSGGSGGAADLDVYTVKHYVLAKGQGLRIRTIKHYVLAKPS